MITDSFKVRQGVAIAARRLCCSAAVLTFAAPGGAGAAQQAADERQAADAPLEEITVIGIRGSQQRSLLVKRNAVGVVDAIVSSDISSFPGLDIGEELQRVTGVTLDRRLGSDGRGTIQVRGLPPDFTRTVINGQTLTSAGDDRAVDFTVFPSELFSGALVVKSPTADLVEGGIAATIDLQTPDPLDYKERVLSFNVEGEYHNLDYQLHPRISTLYIDQFADDRVGVMLGAAYDEGMLRLDRSNPWRYRTRSHDLDGDGINEYENVDNILLPRSVLDLREQDRLGLMGSIQYQATTDLLFSFDALFSERKERRHRVSMDGDLQPNPTALELTVVDNVVRAGLFENVTQRSEEVLRFQDDETLLLNLESDWNFADNWDAFAKISWSESSRVEDDFSFLISGTSNFGYSTLDDPRFVVFTEAIDPLNADSFFLNQARFRPENIGDEETSTRLDVTREFSNGLFRNVKVGLYASNREVESLNFDGRITPAAGTVPFGGDIVGSLPVNNLFSGFGSMVPEGVTTNFLIIDPVKIFENETFFPDGPGTFDPPQDFEDTWQLEEKTISGYFQTDMEFGDLIGNIGVRVARTDLDTRGFDVAGGEIIPNRFENSYTDVLPAANFRYNAGENAVLRLAASRAIARPTLSELAPRRSITTNARTVSAGNPDLDPFKVNQVDLSAEWYFQEAGLLSATAFFKDVESFIIDVVTFEPIETQGTLVDDQGDSVDGEIFEFQRPTNGRGGTVKGIELNYQQPFTWLPYPFNGFGAIVNYTRAESIGSVFIGGQEVRTQLARQPEDSLNVTGYYETERFSVRVTYNWVSDFLLRIRDGVRQEFQKDRGQLDLSSRYTVNERLSINFEAVNLLNETSLAFDTHVSRPFEFDNTGAIFRLGMQYEF